MSNNAVASVVIIFLNGREFLAEAIESVLAQTYREWELLLVDDGSTDGAGELAAAYAARCPARVRYLTHDGRENRGMSASRNLGIEHATGSFVTFLDADDVVLPNALAEQVAMLEASPDAAMLCGSVRWWYSWTKRREDAKRDFVQRVGDYSDVVVPPPTLLLDFLPERILPPSKFIVRRKAAIAVGGYEDAFRSLYEDQVFCAKICLSAPVMVSSRCWYLYRQHPDSCCSVAKTLRQYYPARQRFLEWLSSYVAQQGTTDPRVLRAISAETRVVRHRRLYEGVSLWRRIARQKRRLPSLTRR
ncbi:MAG TPA: glycosyltransferase family A protein [Chloroflexota bacterium]|nr:glycosyltransferase family A protein [Chloroflexota bacterium]